MIILQNFYINLQLFSEEKTEKATPKRKQESREKGQVAKSRELISAILLLLMFWGIKVFIPYIMNELILMSKRMLSLSNIQGDNLYTIKSLMNLFVYCAIVFLKICAPLLLIGLAASLISNYLQVGFLFTLKPLMPKLNKLNPLEGAKRIFSKHALVEFFKSNIKIFIIGYLVYSYLRKNYYSIPDLISMSVENTAAFIGNAIVNIGFRAGFAFLILSIFDYAFQIWDFAKNQKMSKQEIKEEYKQTEGNPQIKSKIKEKQRQLSLRRMMAEVPKADVIITNPTHYAVAIKYDTLVSEAPLVLAKGKDLIAQKIKESAKENKVIIVENKPLAQALYKSVEIGQSIPIELYKAVAEVLAFVYSMKSR